MDHLVITTIAKEYGIEPSLALALCEKESSFRPWAWNPEPKYRYLWDIFRNRPFRQLTPEENASEIPPEDFPTFRNVPRDAEWWGQQASWGLAQIMGAVARERGFSGEFFTELCDPKIGLPYSFMHLRGYLRRYGDTFHALEAYNGGPGKVGKNMEYASDVLAKQKKWAAAP